MNQNISLTYIIFFSLALHSAILMLNVAPIENFRQEKSPIIALKLSKLIPVAKKKEIVKKQEIPITPVKKVIPVKNPKVQEKAKQIAETINQVARTSYSHILISWLARYKKYPKTALRRRIEGEGLLRFKINKSGNLLNYQISKSSGYEILDDAIIDMLKKATPFPEIPDELNTGSFELTVPVDFTVTE